MIKQASEKSKFFWNMCGSLCNALSSLVFLSLISQINGREDAGVFQIAFSAMHLMTTIGCFETRTIQVTDVKETIKFKEYFTFRMITTALMIVFSLIYIFSGQHTSLEVGVMSMIAIYKVVECIADIFEGMYQQHLRIDLSGKSLALRVIFSTLLFTIILVLTKNVVMACMAMSVFSVVFLFLYNYRVGKEFTSVGFMWNKEHAKLLFLQCLPLFISSFMINYVINAPVYALNTYSTSALQADFGFLIKPAFVINLLTLFVFRPVMTTLAMQWNEDKIGEFVKVILKLVIVVCVFSILCVLGAYVLGIPVLNMLSGLDLTEYKVDLVTILIGGGMNAFITIFYYVIAVMRQQNKILLCYGIGFVCALITTPLFVKKLGVLGASISYVTPMVVIVFFMMLVISVEVHKKKKAIKNS